MRVYKGLGVYVIRGYLLGVLVKRESYDLGVYVRGVPYSWKPPFGYEASATRLQDLMLGLWNERTKQHHYIPAGALCEPELQLESEAPQPQRVIRIWGMRTSM